MRAHRGHWAVRQRGTATAAFLNGPTGVAIDGNGNLYITMTSTTTGCRKFRPRTDPSGGKVDDGR